MLVARRDAAAADAGGAPPVAGAGHADAGRSSRSRAQSAAPRRTGAEPGVTGVTLATRTGSPSLHPGHASERVVSRMRWRHATGALALDRPRILGIVNVTPDSFSDGGRFVAVDDARRARRSLIAEGADVIDIGGESTRPQGATPVDAGRRAAARDAGASTALRAIIPSVPISVDTVKARVAREALARGRVDRERRLGAFGSTPTWPTCARAASAGVVLMHSRGDVADMATFAHASYGDDVVGEVDRRARRARRAARARPASRASASSSIRASDSRSAASTRSRCCASSPRFAALGLSGARRRVAQALHRRDHRRARRRPTTRRRDGRRATSRRSSAARASFACTTSSRRARRSTSRGRSCERERQTA